MIKTLTICYVTARKEPKIEWFFDSLTNQCQSDNVNVVVVDTYFDKRMYPYPKLHHYGVNYLKPKPTIWQGEHRITREDWWAKCNTMNTGICFCDTEWIAFVDDRSVLSHGWLQCVQDSMIHNYAVCGSYEKRANIKVENGEIIDEGENLGSDIRRQFGTAVRTTDWYGGSCALPLEWCLRVNGYPEDICDGLGFEDIAFGLLLRNNHLDMRYDSRMRIIEDRTPGESYEGALKRASKPSPNPERPKLAKDYRILDIMGASTTSGNSYDISKLREQVLKGEPFPPPTASHYDWFDGQPISEIE
jgi:hypothetical protein